MLFNSIPFLFGFLPITLAGYWLLAATGRHRPRLVWLAGASMVFYGYWAPRYLLLLLAAMMVNYAVAGALQRAERGGARARWLLAGGVGFNLALLFYFKYFNFFIANLDKLTGAGITIAHIALPLAISFFTFQKIALLFDIDRGKVRLGRISEFATFVLFFPQLIAGPIVHYSELAPQLAARPEVGRSSDTLGRRVITILSRWGILLGTVESAALPALAAATAEGGGRFFGPSGPGNLGGPPGEQTLYPPLRSEDDARRMWDLSLDLAGVSFDEG